MKIVNPIGRDASSYVDANYDVQPSACMCGYTSTFSSALGYPDLRTVNLYKIPVDTIVSINLCIL